MRQQPGPQAAPPRAEPEIIPPGAEFPSAPDFERAPFSHSATRIHVGRLGPLGIVLILLMTGVLAVVGSVVLLGAALIGAAVTGAVIAGAAVSRLVRGAVGRGVYRP